MKKLIVLFVAIVMMLVVPLSIVAENAVVSDDAVIENVAVESQHVIDYEAIAQEVFNRIMAELPEELVASIAELQASWESTNQEGATFGDRLEEFFKPENLVSTVSMLFFIIAGIVLFVMKKRQGASIDDTNNDLVELKKGIDTQRKEIEGIVDKFIDNINLLKDKMDEKNEATEQAKKAAFGTATMLKNIFNNSKTIDEAGKKLMRIDYLNAIGEEVNEEEKTETKEEV